MNNLLKKEERSFFTDSEYKLETPHMQEVTISMPQWSNGKQKKKKGDKDTRMVWLGQQLQLKITHDKMITQTKIEKKIQLLPSDSKVYILSSLSFLLSWIMRII